jgi:hypothetical protein
MLHNCFSTLVLTRISNSAGWDESHQLCSYFREAPRKSYSTWSKALSNWTRLPLCQVWDKSNQVRSQLFFKLPWLVCSRFVHRRLTVVLTLGSPSADLGDFLAWLSCLFELQNKSGDRWGKGWDRWRRMTHYRKLRSIGDGPLRSIGDDPLKYLNHLAYKMVEN